MFNKRLKELRLNLQLTQQALSKDININDRTIRGYESGEIQPTAPTIIKIADYFNVSADYLLGLSDTPINNTLPTYLIGNKAKKMYWISPTKVTKLNNKKGECTTLLNHYLKLNNKGRKKIIERVKDLTNSNDYLKKEYKKTT